MLSQLAYQEFTRRNLYSGVGLPNHCRRLEAITMLISRQRGQRVDGDLVGAGAWLHDIGLLVDDPAEPNYLKRGLRHCEPLFDRWGVQGERREELRHMLLYNHAMRAVDGITPQAELLRQAVHVEHSHGLMRAGLSAVEIRQVFKDYPRGNFNRVLIDFARIAVARDGAGTLLPILFPSFSRAA